MEHATYEVEIPGQPIATLTGSPDQVWEQVTKAMEGQPNGVTPRVTRLDAPAPMVAPVVAPVVRTRDAAVDPAIAERSTLDLLAAQAVGFAPAQPYYDRGTPVIDLGVENARESHREWEAMPRLSEATDTFVAHIAAENRRDLLAPIASMAMRQDGTLTGPGDALWNVEPEALSQLGHRLGVQHPAFLLGIWPALRAANWNQLLATAIGHQASNCPPVHPARSYLEGDQTVRARIRDSKAGDTLWAALSESYAVFDVDSVAKALASGLSKFPDARCEVEYDGRRAKMDVLFHSNVAPEKYGAGEFFKTGIRVKTSDTGGGSVSVSILLWQNLCLNLLCIDVGEFSIARLRHIGSVEALAEKFATAVGQGEAKLGHFLRAWGFACEERLVAPAGVGVYRTEALRLLDEMPATDLTATEVLSGVFLGLGRDKKVDLVRGDLPGLIAAHAADESSAVRLAPITRASVVNAITRYAHAEVGRRDPLRQADLESQAGALLIGGRGGRPVALPFLPSRELTA